MIKRLIYIGRDFSRQMNKKNISAFAASTTFFLFLSFIPMLVLLCSIIPYTSLTEANLMTFITDLTPDAVDSLVVSIIRVCKVGGSGFRCGGDYALVGGKGDACHEPRAE